MAAYGSLAPNPVPRPVDPGQSNRAMVEPLTQSEHDVAVLVGGGLRNGEVAERLCISERTVESHLTHIYQKLGIRSRTELALALMDDVGIRQPRERAERCWRCHAHLGAATVA